MTGDPAVRLTESQVGPGAVGVSAAGAALAARTATLDELAAEYLGLLRRMEQAVTGEPQELAAVADGWVRCADSTGAAAETVRRGTDPAGLGWFGLSADQFDARTVATTSRMSAIAAEVAATAAPLRDLAVKLGESRRNLVGIIDWYLRAVSEGRALFQQVLGTIDPHTTRRIYRDYVRQVGLRATAWGRSVLETYQYFTEQAAERLRDVAYLRLGRGQQLRQLTPYGQHYVAELGQGNMGVLASPTDLSIGLLYGTTSFPFELSRKINTLGWTKGSRYAFEATPAGIFRNVAMLGLGHEVLEDPFARSLKAVTGNVAVTYGSNAVSGLLFGKNARTDVPGLLAVNNSITSLMLLNRPGFLPQPELIDEYGRPEYLTNRAYNWNTLYDMVAIGGPPALIFGAETALSHRSTIGKAVDSGDVLRVAAEVERAGQAGLTSGLTSFSLAGLSTVIGGVVDPPPEPGVQRSVYEAVRDTVGGGQPFDDPA